jgi:hypothetical protein
MELTRPCPLGVFVLEGEGVCSPFWVGEAKVGGSQLAGGQDRELEYSSHAAYELVYRHKGEVKLEER